MLVIDLDGTLLKEDKTVSDENAEAIRRAHAHGVTIVLATGRPPVGARRVLERLAPAAGEYLITFNGALTTDLGNGRHLAVHELSRSDFDTLAGYLAKRGLFAYAFSRDRCLAPAPHPIVDAESRFNTIQAAVIDFSRLAPDTPLIKIMATGEPEHLDAVWHSIPPDWHGRYQVVRSAPVLLEFLHPSASKGQAVRSLCRQLAIPAADVIGIGDAGNDTDLVAWAGLGIAMGNATPALRAIADHVTATNEEHGIAQVIEQFILAGQPCPGKQKSS
ncbi:MAG: HAD family phosphatase [Clostridiaceae bacterium]|jgi:Cof subfamily protein (haloacid dehalogenase superfamily)|nr:HAD family phosphatase [Clostridiaceae bacterium]